MISRNNFFLSVVICVFILSSQVSASVLKDALEEHLKDIAHDEAEESIKHNKQKGEKVHHLESQLDDNRKNHYSKAKDEAKFLKKEHDSKSTADSDAYKGYNSQQDKSEDSHATGYKTGHKKGHHKQGFQNSYHKDESSNKSTYFDDFDDEGNQAAYKSRLNSHDNKGDKRYRGSHNNGQEYLRNNYHGGDYNRYGDVGNKYNTYRDYGKKYYLDDASNYNKYRNGHNIHDRGNIHDVHKYRAPVVYRDPGWDWQRSDDRRVWDEINWRRDPGWQDDRGWKNDRGWQNERGWQNGRRWQQDPAWEANYGGPGYYDDRGLRHDGGYGYGPNHGYGYGYDESRTAPVAEIPKNVPMVAHRKQTITIYEDPRYESKDNGQLRREGDYLQLEFKPSKQRYATATYDDSYYQVPAREGGVESSKINKLVYNYRRQ